MKEKMYVMAIRKCQLNDEDFEIETFNLTTKKFKNYILIRGTGYPGANKVYMMTVNDTHITSVANRMELGCYDDSSHNRISKEAKNEVDEIMYASKMEV
jgi:hypothetical protein